MNPLFAVRDCLREGDLVTAGQLSTELKLSRSLVEDLLQYWERRHYVEVIDLTGGGNATNTTAGDASVASGACGSCGTGACGSCPSSSRLGFNSQRLSKRVYRWCGPALTT